MVLFMLGSPNSARHGLCSLIICFSCAATSICAQDGKAAENPDANFKPDQSALPAKVPEGAIVLFDGKDKLLFVGKEGAEIDWPVEEGCLISSSRESRSNHIVSQWHFRDAEIHVEFNISKESNGNSGIYIHGNYEMQILDSAQKRKWELTDHDEGAIYGFQKPSVNTAKPAGDWQVYDILYRAPRRNDKGEITAEGSITAWLNGQKVQDYSRFGEPRSTYHPYRYKTTDYLKAIWEFQKKNLTGPFFLQDHQSPCRFRNIWVQPLDGEAFFYQATVR